MFEVSLLLSLLVFSSLVTLYVLGFVSKVESFAIAFYTIIIRFILSTIIIYMILSYDYLSKFSDSFLNDNQLLSIIIFSSLLLINIVAFIKLPKLIGKISARYILDTNPAKCIKIESDLDDGIIDDLEAKKQKNLLQNRVNFYGVFDGLSSFIKKDFMVTVFMFFVVGVIGYFLGLYQYSLYINFIILFAIFTQLAILLVNLSYVIILIKSIHDDFILII